MELNYSVSGGDLFAYTNYVLTKGRSTKFPKKALYVAYFFLGLLVISFLFCFDLAGAFAGDGDFFTAYVNSLAMQLASVSIVAIVIFCGLYCLGYFLTLSRCYKPVRENPHLYRDQHLQLTEEGLSHHSSVGRSVFYWPAIKKIIVMPTHLFISITSNSAIIVARRYFENDAALEKFVQEAHRYQDAALDKRFDPLSTRSSDGIKPATSQSLSTNPPRHDSIQ